MLPCCHAAMLPCCHAANRQVAFCEEEKWKIVSSCSLLLLLFFFVDFFFVLGFSPTADYD